MAKEKRLISVDAHKLEGLLSDCFDVIKSVKPTQLALMGALQVWIGCCKNQPTVDAVEVVRCKDCKWYDADCEICVYLSEDGDTYDFGCDVNMKPDDFCSYGERRI